MEPMPPIGPILNQRREVLEEKKRTRFFYKRTQKGDRVDLFCGMYQLMMYADGCMWLDYFGEGRQLHGDECTLVAAAIAMADSDPQLARLQLTPLFDRIIFDE